MRRAAALLAIPLLAVPAPCLAQPQVLRVDVPGYRVASAAGRDYVEIPGGEILLVPGRPMVPYYVVTLDLTTEPSGRSRGTT